MQLDKVHETVVQLLFDPHFLGHFAHLGQGYGI